MALRWHFSIRDLAVQYLSSESGQTVSAIHTPQHLVDVYVNVR